MVVAKALAATACMVARAEGSALAPAWAGAVEPPATPPTGRLKAHNVNAGGSRMREIRTYGLKRGCWPVRFARRAGVYSTTTPSAAAGAAHIIVPRASARVARGVRPVLARRVRQVRCSLRFRACAPICLAPLGL